MSEKPTLEPGGIGNFLFYVSSLFASRADQARIKPKDMAPDFETAITLGLMLAKRQPELVDACYQFCNFIRTPKQNTDDMVDVTLTIYQQMVDAKSKEA